MDVSRAWEYRHWFWIGEELQELGLKLNLDNIPAILELTSFINRSKKHPERCSAYLKNAPCHKIGKLEDFNCLICACPNYNTETDQGYCKIKSKFGKLSPHPNTSTGLILNCEDCPIYHTRQSVEAYLRKNIDSINKKIAEARSINQTKDYQEAIAKLTKK